MAFQKNRELDGLSNPKVQGDNNKVNFCSHGPVKFQVFIAILSLRWTKTNFSLRRVEKKKKKRSESFENFWNMCPRLFHGPADSHIYLPSHVKSSIPFSQFLQIYSLCSDDSNFPDKSVVMCQFFDKSSYPVSVIQAGHHRT